MTFVVPLLEFRQALLATRVHADPKSDTFSFVRLLPGDDLAVMATDRFSAALARVRVDDHGDGDVSPVDLALDDVAKVLAVFRMPSDKAEWAEAALRVTREGHDVTFSDAGGLFDGQSLTVTAHDVDGIPDLRSFLAQHLGAAPTEPDRDSLHGLGIRLAQKVAVATKTYTEAAYAALHGASRPAWVVTVGPDFICAEQAREAAYDRDQGEPLSDHSPIRWRNRWHTYLRDGLTTALAGLRSAGVERFDFRSADGDARSVDL